MGWPQEEAVGFCSFLFSVLVLKNCLCLLQVLSLQRKMSGNGVLLRPVSSPGHSGGLRELACESIDLTLLMGLIGILLVSGNVEACIGAFDQTLLFDVLFWM